MTLKQLMGTTAVFLLLTLAAAACAGTAVPPTIPPTRGEPVADLPDLGAAPEFRNDVWLNSDEPVTLADQRGKVVLLEFWTFG